MLSFLGEIVEGVLDLPFVLVNLVIALINAIIVLVAAFAELILSLLPGFPEPPSAPGGVVGALLWFFPLGTVLSFFALMVTCWIGFLAVKMALRWVKLL